MKKTFISIFLIMAILFTLALTGCTEKTDAKKDLPAGDGADLAGAEVTHYAVP